MAEGCEEVEHVAQRLPPVACIPLSATLQEMALLGLWTVRREPPRPDEPDYVGGGPPPPRAEHNVMLAAGLG